MFNLKNDNRGLVRWIFIIIIAIIILSYFGFDLRGIIEAEGMQNNLSYVWGGVIYVWNAYIAGPFDYLWNDIFIDLIWSAFIENMEIIKGGGPVIDPEIAPKSF